MNPLYVVVRADLCAGMKMAQACHATRELSLRHPDEAVSDNLVVLEADAAELAALVTRAAGVCTAAPFYEPDLGGELSAVALGVGARRLVSCLRLARSKVEPVASAAA